MKPAGPAFVERMVKKRPLALRGGGLFLFIGLLFTCLSASASAVTVRQLYNPNGVVRAMTVSAGVVYMGGDFTQLADAAGGNVVLRQHLAAVDLATGLPLGWDPGANSGVQVLALRNGKVLAGGDFTFAGGATRSALVELDAWPATGAASTWAPAFAPAPQVRALAVGPSLVYAGGTFSQAGGQSRAGVAALDAAGLATAFNANLNGAAAGVNALVLNGSTLYLAGSFNQAGGQSRSGLAAVDAASGSAVGWAPANGLTGPVYYALSLAGTHLFVGGVFSGTLGGSAVSNLAAVDTITATAAWMQAGADGAVRSLWSDPNGRLLVGGDFSNLNGSARRRFASVDGATGVLEATLAADLSGGSAKVYALNASGAEDLLGGDFNAVAGVAVSAAAAVALGAYVAPSFTPTPVLSPTPSATPTRTPSATPSPSASATPTATASLTPVLSATPSRTASPLPSASPTPGGPRAQAGSLYVYPNPLGPADAAHLALLAVKPGLARWQLLTPRGSQVGGGEAALLAGDNLLPLDRQGLSAGLYLLRVTVSDVDGGQQVYAPYKLAVLP